MVYTWASIILMDIAIPAEEVRLTWYGIDRRNVLLVYQQVLIPLS